MNTIAASTQSALFEFPWKRRERIYAQEARQAEERLYKTRQETEKVTRLASQIEEEVILNDWVATIRTLFDGNK